MSGIQSSATEMDALRAEVARLRALLGERAPGSAAAHGKAVAAGSTPAVLTKPDGAGRRRSRVNAVAQPLADGTRQAGLPRAVHASEGDERLRLALGASMMVGIWDWDLATNLIYSDANFARIYGLDPSWAERGAPLEEYTRRFHPHDMPSFEAALAETLKEGTPFSHEYRILQADGTVRWVLARGSVLRDGTGEPLRFCGATVDITDRRQSEARQAALVELGDRFRNMDDTAEMAFVAAEIIGRALGLSRTGYGSVDTDGDHLDVERDWTDGGVASIAGRHRFADYGSFIQDLRAGKTVIIDDVDTDPRTAADAERLHALSIQALLNVPVMEHGRLVAILFLHDAKVRHWSSDKLDFVRDIAQRTRDAVERRRAEDHQRLLMSELQHRVKNTLTMVQAIASQTFRETATSQAQEAFTHRVVALSHANDLLTRAGWTAAPINDIVKGATIPHCAGPERFTLMGPAIEIAARAALSLTLALHELCTNASKYGALSTETGHVTIAWDVLPDATFRLQWAERGGPPVTKPARTGFGTRLIQRSLGPQMGGDVRTDFEPIGVTCTFAVPLAAVQETYGSAADGG